MNRKIVSLLKMLILSLGLIGLCVSLGRVKEKGNDKVTSSEVSYDFAMGTTISVILYSDDKDLDKTSIKDSIVQEINNLDDNMLSWRSDESELGILNNSYMPNTEHNLSPELYSVLQQSLNVCKDSQGALDITIRPLAALWNIEGDESREFVPPSSDEIEDCLALVDYNKLSLGTDNSVIIKAENVIVDLGATGKGYALDKARGVLDEFGIDGALITVGGSILVFGEKTDGDSWKVGVRDPEKPNDTNAMIGHIEFPPGTTTCVSTSGGYEKFKTYEGNDYHHILDSKTGYPAESDLLSVTVVCDNGLYSDGLSTACFVLGYEKSLPLLEKYEAQAVFMDSNGDIMVTGGLKDNWVEY